METAYIEYLHELDKIKDITDEDFKNVYIKYYNIDSPSSGASLFNKLNLKTISNLTNFFLKIVLVLLNKIYQSFYKKDNTIKCYFSAIRTTIKKKYGLGSPQYILTLELLKQPAGTKERLDTQYRLRVKEKNRNKMIFYLEDIYKIINEALINENIFYKIVALMLCSGSRTKELLNDNIYTIHPTKENYVIIGNIGKRREGQLNKNDKLERPLIYFTNVEFIKTVDMVRNVLNQYLNILNNNNELDQTIHRVLSSVVEKLFKRCDLTPRTLRKIYGNMAYLLFVNNDCYDRNTYLSDILGHSPSDISTASSYSMINIIRKPDINDNLQKQIYYLQEQIDNLQEQLSKHRL